MTDVNVTVDVFGNPYAFQYFGHEVLPQSYAPGYPVFFGNHLPQSSMQRVGAWVGRIQGLLKPLYQKNTNVESTN